MRKLKEKQNYRYILIALFGVVLFTLTSLFAVLLSGGSKGSRKQLTAASDGGVSISVFGGTLNEADASEYVEIGEDGTYLLSYPSETLPSDIKNQSYYTERARYYSVTFMPGTYEVTLAGAQGGSAEINNKKVSGSYGARTSGTITFDERTTVYIHVGGAGSSASDKSDISYGGYNGGGDGGRVTVDGMAAAGGGGATDIRLANSKRTQSPRSVMSVFNDENSLSSRIMVAAGGGGASAYSSGVTSLGSNATKLSGGALNKSSALSTLANGELGFGGGSAQALSVNADWTSNGTDYSNQTYALAGGGGGGYYGGSAGSCYYYTQNNLTNFSDNTTAGSGSNYINTNGEFAFDGVSSTDGVNGAEVGSADGYAVIKRVAAASVEESVQKVKATVIAENSASAYSGTETDASYYSYNGAALTLNYPAAESRHVETDSRADRYWKVKFYAGVYTIDLYGAQGGMYTISDSETGYALGGNGGQTSLTIRVVKEMYLYFYVGGAGDSAQTSNATTDKTRSYGGFNGGGTSPVNSAAGGGATDIRFANSKDSFDNASLNTRLAVAGGGGGAGNGAAGGAGGGLESGAGTVEASHAEGNVAGTAASQLSAGVNTSFGVMNGEYGLGGGIIKRDTANPLPVGTSYPLGYTEGGGGGGGYYGGARASGYYASGSGGSGYCYGLEGAGEPHTALTNALNSSGITVADQSVTSNVNGYELDHTVNDGVACARDGYAVITFKEEVADAASASDVGVSELRLLGAGIPPTGEEPAGVTLAETYSYYYHADGTNALKLNLPTKLVTRNEDTDKGNRYYEVTLSPGAYRFTLAGGQGGSMQSDTSNRNGIGGAGAVVSAVLTLTSETTLYIHIGGAGNSYSENYNGVRLGGYNGGGDAVGSAAAGGGATDIRTSISRDAASPSNLLTTYNDVNSVSTRIMVAGGGGGANDFTAGGAGGGVSGKSLEGDSGAGGSFGSGGTGGNMLATNNGYGGGVLSTDTVQDGGGGGGGYSGGTAGGSTTAAGGGGSSFVSGATYGSSTCNTVSNYVFTDLEVDTNGNKSSGVEGLAGGVGGEGTPCPENGYALIERVNAAPVAKDDVKYTGERGDAIAVTAANLATDPDSPVAVSDPVIIDTTKPNLYYKNQNGEYVPDEVGLVTLGTATIEGSETTVFNINGYPNRALSYVSVDGVVTLYVRVYDKGLDGNGELVRETFVPVTFTVTIDDYDDILTKTNSDFTIEVSGSALSLEYKDSLSVKSDDALTLSCDQLLENADVFTASNDLYFAIGSNIAYNYDTTTNLKAVVSTQEEIKNVYSIDSSGNRVSIEALSALHLYGSATGRSATEYSSSVTVYQVDKLTGYVISRRTLNLAYTIKNSAPVLGETTSVTLDVGGDVVVNIADLISDAENTASNLPINTATHSITSVTVPTNEISVEGSAYYYSAEELLEAKATGFSEGLIDSTDSPRAFVEYAFTDGNITLTGLRATYSRYSPTREKQNLGHFYVGVSVQDAFDSQVYIVPLAVTVTNSAPVAYNSEAAFNAPDTVHKTILYSYSTLPTVTGSVGDEVYITPFALYSGVGSPTAIGGIKDGATFEDKHSNAVGISFDYDFYKETDAVNNDFVNFTMSGNDLVQSMYASLGMVKDGIVDTSILTLEAVEWYYPISNESGRIVSSGANNGLGVYNGVTEVINGVPYYKTYAVKATFNASTADAYIIGEAVVNDAHGTLNNTVGTVAQFAVLVENTDPEIKNAVDVYTEDGKLSVERGDGGKISRVNYNIHVKTGDTIFFTPYDFVTDTDMQSYGLTGAFNLNRFNGTIESDGSLRLNSNARGSLNGDATKTDGQAFTEIANNLERIKNGTTFSSALTSNAYTNNFNGGKLNTAANGVTVNKSLYFKRVDGVISNVLTNTETGTANTACLDVAGCTSASVLRMDNSRYDCDVIRISAAKANNTPATVVFKIFDNQTSTGDGVTVTVNISVTNSLPRFLEGATREYTMKVLADNANYSSLAFNANALLTDDDGDILSFDETSAPEILTKNEEGGFVNSVIVNGVSYSMNEFMSAEYDATRTTLTVTALSSTIALPYGAWVRFTATDGKESATLEFQLEVLNSAMTAHSAGDYSLNLTDYDNELVSGTTHIDTAVINDTASSSESNSYYFVSNSTVAEEIINGTAEFDGEDRVVKGLQSKVKVVADDYDGLQRSPVLAAANPFANTIGNIYADVDTTNLSSLMPQITKTFSTTTAVSVMNDSGETTHFKILLFLRDAATSEVTAYDTSKYTSSLSPELAEAFFDDKNRFSVVDWAIEVTPTANQELNFAIIMRDNDAFGGDTYGLSTAYNFNRASQRAEQNVYALGVKLRVVDAGLVSYEHYIDNYNGTYVVEGNDGAAYVATYDGAQDSMYDVVPENALVYHTDKQIIDYDASGSTVTLREANAPTDGSNAGVNTGELYEDSNTYDKAFVYSDTVNIANSGSIYLPISYFAVPDASFNTYTSTGVSFSANAFAGYAYHNASNEAQALAINDFTDTTKVVNSLTLSDGLGNVWTGENIHNNPYINISAMHAPVSGYDMRYVNRAFSVFTNPDKIGELTPIQEDVREIAKNATSNGFVGNFSKNNNGALMYLDGVPSDTSKDFIENQYGLSISKNSMRSVGTSLTLTLCLGRYSSDGTLVSDGGASRLVDISVNLNVENAPIMLSTANSNNQQSTVRYDTQSNTYFTSVSMESSGDAITVAPIAGDGVVDGSTVYIGYYDADNLTIDSESFTAAGVSADKAMFSLESTLKHSLLSSELQKYIRSGTEHFNNALNSNHKFISSENRYSAETVSRTQSSLLKYFNIPGFNSLVGVPSDYQPNSGVYGTNANENNVTYKVPDTSVEESGNEGYSSYFSLSVNPDGSLVINPRSRTIINSDVLSAFADGTAPSAIPQDTIKQIYESRGLVPVFGANNVVESAYYPLKVLLYDGQSSADFGKTTFTAMEIRVTVLNTPIASTSADNTVTLSMAKGESSELSLADILTDKDFARTVSNGIFTKDSRDAADIVGIMRENGDYVITTNYTGNISDFTLAQFIDSTSNFNFYNSSGNTDFPVTMSISNGEDGAASLTFTVNDRIVTSDHQTRDSVTFRVSFTDSSGANPTILFITVNITNTSPEIINTNVILTMNSSEYFTALATSYTDFVSYGVSRPANAASLNSKTYNNFINKTVSNSSENLTLTKAWKYEDTGNAEFAFLEGSVGNYSHGFLTLARDDAPYSLRVSYSSALNKQIDSNIIVRSLNGYSNEYSEDGGAMSTALEIVAKTPCRNVPLILTVSDGQGGSTNVRIIVTINSRAPVPLQEGSNLSPYLTQSSSGVLGEYDLYLTPSSEVEEYTFVDAGEKSHTVACGSVTIPLNSIVIDEDGDDNNNLSLYTYWSSSNINDRTIKNTGKSYYSATESGGSIVFNCTSYNRNQASSGIVEFYVNDPGGSATGSNLCYVRINVYTMYNSLINKKFGEEIENRKENFSSSVTRSITSKYDAERNGMDTSLDQISVVGGANSEITDLDETGKYTLSLYVLANATEDGIEPMVVSTSTGRTTIRQYNFVNNYIIAPRNDELRNIYDGYVYLDETKEDFAKVFGDNRLLTMNSDGSVNSTYKYETFADYFEVMPTITESGEVILKFKAQSYMTNVNFYVQVTKQLVRTDNSSAKLSSGFLFSINNRNSQPFAQKDVVEVRGTKGYTQTFNVFGTSDSLFADYDTGDSVALDLPMLGKLVDYENIVSKSDPGDWNNSDKGYAITLRSNSDGTLTVRINRRIDEFDFDANSYKPEVTLHLSIPGTDEYGETCVASLNIVVCNNAPEAKLNSTYVQNEKDGNVLYTVAEAANNGIVEIRAMVRQDATEDLFVRFSDIVSDADYDAALAANDAYVDSFRLGSQYSVGGAIDTLTGTDKLTITYLKDSRNVPLAEVTPVYSSNPAHMEGETPFVYRGFTIRALTYETSSTAEFYVRVVDRSIVAAPNSTDGVLFKVIVSIANSAPTVIEGTDYSVISLIGAENSNNLQSSATFDVTSFVSDPNPDNQNRSMRISTYTANSTSQVYTSKGEPASSTALVSMSFVNDDDSALNSSYRSFKFNPRAGLYGEQSFTITVTDGYSSDEKTVTFTVIVRVLFDYNDLPELQSINTYRAKTIDVTVAKLIPSFIISEDEVAAVSDNFIPSAFYSIVSVTPEVADSTYMTLNKKADGSGFTLAALAITPSERKVTVNFAVNDYYIDGKQVTFQKTLNINIAENTPPELIADMRHKVFSKNSADEYALSDGGEVVLSYDLIVSDAENDEITLKSARSSVSALVEVSIANNFLTIKFNASGISNVTLVVSDETGVETALSFKVENFDLDSPSLWLSIAASFQASPVVWYVSIFGIILIIIVIAIILSVRNRRIQRRLEDQAQLAAELEIEKEVYGLNGSVMQSYGYLPPSDEDKLDALAAAVEQNELLEAGTEQALGLEAPPSDDDENI